MFVLSKAVLGSEHTAVELMNLEKSQAPLSAGAPIPRSIMCKPGFD